jgi:hypothetical protein
MGNPLGNPIVFMGKHKEIKWWGKFWNTSGKKVCPALWPNCLFVPPPPPTHPSLRASMGTWEFHYLYLIHWFLCNKIIIKVSLLQNLTTFSACTYCIDLDIPQHWPKPWEPCPWVPTKFWKPDVEFGASPQTSGSSFTASPISRT